MSGATDLTPGAGGDLLWSVGLLGYPFAERIEAAARLGYSGISANAWELEEELDSGGVERLRELRGLADAAGVKLTVLEPAVTWLPPVASGMLPRVEWGKLETIGEEMGIEAMLALAYAEPETTQAELADALGRLCDLAAGHGWIVGLEFTPNSAVKSLAAAIAVVEMAGRENGRIIFDTWHFFRGDPDYEVLAGVDGALIEYVQLNDAAAEVVGTLAEDTRNRKLPGEGDLDLIAALRALEAIGALRSVGPEVFRPHTPELTCLEAVTGMAVATGKVLRAARQSTSERKD